GPAVGAGRVVAGKRAVVEREVAGVEDRAAASVATRRTVLEIGAGIDAVPADTAHRGVPREGASAEREAAGVVDRAAERVVGRARSTLTVPVRPELNFTVSDPAWAFAALSAARRVVALNVPVPVGVTLPAESPSVVTV